MDLENSRKPPNRRKISTKLMNPNPGQNSGHSTKLTNQASKKTGENSHKVDEEGGAGLNRLSPKFHTSQTVTDQDSKNSKMKFDFTYLPTDENNE